MAPAINLIDPEYFAAHGHPWDQYEWLRANSPVFWHDEPDGPGFGRSPNTTTSAPSVGLPKSLVRTKPE